MAQESRTTANWTNPKGLVTNESAKIRSVGDSQPGRSDLRIVSYCSPRLAAKKFGDRIALVTGERKPVAGGHLPKLEIHSNCLLKRRCPGSAIELLDLSCGRGRTQEPGLYGLEQSATTLLAISPTPEAAVEIWMEGNRSGPNFSDDAK